MSKIRGAGDVVAVITKYTGIKAVVELLDVDCKCEMRQEKMNVWSEKMIYGKGKDSEVLRGES